MSGITPALRVNQSRCSSVTYAEGILLILASVVLANTATDAGAAANDACEAKETAELRTYRVSRVRRRDSVSKPGS